MLAFNLSYLFERAICCAKACRGLLSWVAAGKLKPLPVRELGLERVADAHRALESGATVGKLALIP